MLGQRQLEEVRKWVRKEGEEEGRLLVLVSGVPVTRNWSEGKDEFDSWAVSHLRSSQLLSAEAQRDRATLTSEKKYLNCSGVLAEQ